jgi:LysR family glycine cleavage system transcriptional activator
MKGSRRPAPLNGLRAFEAAARHLSFAAAAEELFVTPGAISHQIAGVEAFLGIKLFVRSPRSIALTPAAEACLPLLTKGFATLREAVARLQDDEPQRALTVRVAPAFATRWLLPRLASFTRAHPEITLSVSTGPGLAEAARQDAGPVGDASKDNAAADLSIRFGRGHYGGLVCEKLLAAEVTPVCGTRLVGVAATTLEPADLRHYTLLHDDTTVFDDGRSDWAVWLAAAGVEGVDAARGPRFSHTGLALEAAEDGLGFALGITALTASDVRSGRLVAPFALKLPSSFAYHLVYGEALAHRADLQAFRAWLLAEAARGDEPPANDSPPRP